MKKRQLFKEPIGGEEFLVGEVYYNLGGANYFSGGTDPQGYWLSVTPEKHETRTLSNGVEYVTRSLMAFSGVRLFLKEAARFNQKELEKLTPTPEQIDELKAHVMAKRAKEAAAREPAAWPGISGRKLSGESEGS